MADRHAQTWGYAGMLQSSVVLRIGAVSVRLEKCCKAKMTDGEITMLNHEKILMNDAAEGMKGISSIEKEIQALQDAINALKKVAKSEAETVAEDEPEDPNAYRCIFANKAIADFWFRWPKRFARNFAGFVDYDMPSKLSVGKRYGLSIGPVALIGEHIQLIAMLFLKEDWEDDTLDAPAGLLIEEYQIGTENFKDMAIGVFAPWHESIISVDVERIRDAFGTICLKEVDGKLRLDWHTFAPEQTPQSEAFYFGWRLADRIKKYPLNENV